MIEQTPNRIYFAVPDHYTVGTEFETYAEAETAAVAKIREIDGCPGSMTRAFVDVRVADSNGDRPIYRTEIKVDRAHRFAVDDEVSHVDAPNDYAVVEALTWGKAKDGTLVPTYTLRDESDSPHRGDLMEDVLDTLDLVDAESPVQA